MSPNTPYRIAITAQEFEALLAQIPSKIDSSIIRTTLANADQTTVPTTKAVQDALDVISGDFSSLGNLAFTDDVDLSSTQVKGVTPIAKGGTGANSVAGARANLGILTQTEIETLIAEAVPTIQEVDLSSSQAVGVLPISKGGTGAQTATIARGNLGVLSSSETRSLLLTQSVILTDAGRVKINAATVSEPVVITRIGVSDALGTITSSRTSLQNEVWRGDVNPDSKEVTNVDEAKIFSGNVPTTATSFVVREVAYFDQDGLMIAIGQTQPIEKPSTSLLRLKCFLVLDSVLQASKVITKASVGSLDDLKGFTDALLSEAGVADSGVPDVNGASQRVDAIKRLSASVSGISYKSIDDLFNESPLASEIGDIISTGGTKWKCISEGSPITINNYQAFGALNVLDCGAGNGIDDSDALDLAVSRVKNGGTIFFPKRKWNVSGDLEPEYLITRDIVINKADITLVGDASSEFGTGIVCRTANVKMFNFKNPGSRVSNLGFFGDGSNTAFGTTVGIYMDRRDNGDSDNFANLDFIIDECLFLNNAIDIHGYGRNVSIKDSLFTHSKVAIRGSSWIPSGGTTHIDMRGWRITGNRFHSIGWQYNYPATTEVPPSSFGAWDSFCIQMPTDSDNFSHIEVSNNNLDRGYAIFYRGMVSGLHMTGNTSHDFNGALLYGFASNAGAIAAQNKYPSVIADNQLNLRESYDQPYDQPKTFGISVSDCDVLTLSNNSVKNTLQEGVKLKSCFHTIINGLNVQNAGQEKFNTVAFPAVTLDSCSAVIVDDLVTNAKYADNNFNTAGLNLVGCTSVDLGEINVTKASVKVNATPEQLSTASAKGLGWVVPSLSAPFTLEDGRGYNRLFDGSCVINMRVLPNSAASGSTIFTLPEGCRPAGTVRQAGGGSNQFCTVAILSSGVVSITHNGTAPTLLTIDFNFLVGV